ncbi:unnamed protein product, partial [Prorocentrum cordatum]
RAERGSRPAGDPRRAILAQAARRGRARAGARPPGLGLGSCPTYSYGRLRPAGSPRGGPARAAQGPHMQGFLGEALADLQRGCAVPPVRACGPSPPRQLQGLAGEGGRYNGEELARLLAVVGEELGAAARGVPKGPADVGRLVELIRQATEALVWGERHDVWLFDIFCERQALAAFVGALSASGTDPAVRVQLLQTLSILVQNARRETSFYYLLSGGHLNSLLSWNPDLRDEEVLAYYVTFMKSLALRLDGETALLVLDGHKESDGERTFPLFEQAVRFTTHRDQMVRTAARTTVLSLLGISQPQVRGCVVRAACRTLSPSLTHALRTNWGIASAALRLRDAEALQQSLEAEEDLLGLLHELFLLNVGEVRDSIASSVFTGGLLPLLGALSPPIFYPDGCGQQRPDGDEASLERAPDSLAGAWFYHGQTSGYHIVEVRPGQLRFEEPSSDGRCVRGDLRACGDWLQAQVRFDDGMEHGCIRLRLADGLLTSNFRGRGCPDWGEDVLAHRAGAEADRSCAQRLGHRRAPGSCGGCRLPLDGLFARQPSCGSAGDPHRSVQQAPPPPAQRRLPAPEPPAVAIAVRAVAVCVRALGSHIDVVRPLAETLLWPSIPSAVVAAVHGQEDGMEEEEEEEPGAAAAVSGLVGSASAKAGLGAGAAAAARHEAPSPSVLIANPFRAAVLELLGAAGRGGARPEAPLAAWAVHELLGSLPPEVLDVAGLCSSGLDVHSVAQPTWAAQESRTLLVEHVVSTVRAQPGQPRIAQRTLAALAVAVAAAASCSNAERRRAAAVAASALSRAGAMLRDAAAEAGRRLQEGSPDEAAGLVRCFLEEWEWHRAWAWRPDLPACGSAESLLQCSAEQGGLSSFVEAGGAAASRPLLRSLLTLLQLKQDLAALCSRKGAVAEEVILGSDEPAFEELCPLSAELEVGTGGFGARSAAWSSAPAGPAAGAAPPLPASVGHRPAACEVQPCSSPQGEQLEIMIQPTWVQVSDQLDRAAGPAVRIRAPVWRVSAAAVPGDSLHLLVRVHGGAKGGGGQRHSARGGAEEEVRLRFADVGARARVLDQLEARRRQELQRFLGQLGSFAERSAVFVATAPADSEEPLGGARSPAGKLGGKAATMSRGASGGAASEFPQGCAGLPRALSLLLPCVVPAPTSIFE